MVIMLKRSSYKWLWSVVSCVLMFITLSAVDWFCNCLLHGCSMGIVCSMMFTLFMCFLSICTIAKGVRFRQTVLTETLWMIGLATQSVSIFIELMYIGNINSNNMLDLLPYMAETNLLAYSGSATHLAAFLCSAFTAVTISLLAASIKS